MNITEKQLRALIDEAIVAATPTILAAADKRVTARLTRPRLRNA